MSVTEILGHCWLWSSLVNFWSLKMQSNANLRKQPLHCIALQDCFFALFTKEAITLHGKILILATFKNC